MADEPDGAASALRLDEIEPTVFFAADGPALRQAVDITLTNDGPPQHAALAWRVAGHEMTAALGTVATGRTRHRVLVPDVREPTQVELRLYADGAWRDRRILLWMPTRHWEVHLVQRSHHDLGYTDLPSNVLREHDGFMDTVLDYCDATADWPDDCRFRYVVEQGWSLLHYLEHRPPAVAERVRQLILEGRIEVTALLGNETSELCGPEEQIRLLYPSFRLKRRLGVPIHVAQLNDVPGVSWGLAKVLAGAGIRYFIPGIPDYFTWGGYSVHPFWDEQAVLPRDMSGAFWWEAQDGNRVLFWYGQGIGGLWDETDAEASIPARLRELAARGYPYDLLRCRVTGGERDNAPPSLRFAEIVRAWNARWAYPRLIVSTNARFMTRFEAEYGAGLRVLRGDLPNTDYTVGAASTARETGINRLAHDTLLSAEKLAACATWVSDYPYPADMLAEAYDAALLYDEHTWGMGHAIGPAQEGNWAQKREFATRAAALSHDVLSKASNRIADQVHLPEEGYHLLVFNPLAQPRTDLVRVPGVTLAPCGRPMRWHGSRYLSGTASGRNLVDLPLALWETPFALIDISSGASVPYQIETLADPLAARPWAAERYALGAVNPAYRKELVFVATDVPPLGYKAYRVVPASATPDFASDLRVGDGVLENRFYRLTLDPASGVIASLWDKELGREWVDPDAPHGFNQVVVRSPEDGGISLPLRSQITPGLAGPVCASLIVRGEARDCPQRTQEITLYAGLKRLDLATRLLKDATPLLEWHIAFPFALHAPQFRYEASNAIIAPIRDQLPGTNTDAYAAHHWVAAWDGAGGVAWSSHEAPIVEIGGLWPGYVSQAHHGVAPPGYGHDFLRDPAQLTRGHLYSYIMASNFRTNFSPVQVGDTLFRYTLTTHGGDWQAAHDFGWRAQTPLWPVWVRGPQAGALPPAAAFCQLDAPNAHLLTIKGAEDGDGVIVRLSETAGVATVARLTLPQVSIAEAWRTTLVEEDVAALPCDEHTVQVPLAAHGITTVRCRTGQHFPAIRWYARF